MYNFQQSLQQMIHNWEFHQSQYRYIMLNFCSVSPTPPLSSCL